MTVCVSALLIPFPRLVLSISRIRTGGIAVFVVDADCIAGIDP